MAEAYMIAKKKALEAALGQQDFKVYAELLKELYHGRISKEDFQDEARKILPQDAVHYHNELFLLLWNKVSSMVSDISLNDFVEVPLEETETKEKPKKKRVRKKRKTELKPFENQFMPVAVSEYIPHSREVEEQEETTGKGKVTSHVLEGSLLDVPSVHGIMIATAWELELDNVEDKAVELMLVAVRLKIKSILMAVVSRRKPYKIRENRFKYAFGCPATNVYLQNAQKLVHYSDFSNSTTVTEDAEQVPKTRPTSEWAESEAATELACDTRPHHSSSPLTPWDLFEALQFHRSVIPSHSVYATIMEKIIARLRHPNLEEIEQGSIDEQKNKLNTVAVSKVYNENYSHPALALS